MKLGLKFATAWSPAMQPSRPHLVRRMRCPLLWLLPAAALCACTRSTVMIPDAPACLAYVPPTMLAAVAGAPLPADDSAGSWVAFANTQTGRLEEANEKPAAIAHIIGECERRHAAALAKAERDSLRWWQRLF